MTHKVRNNWRFFKPFSKYSVKEENDEQSINLISIAMKNVLKIIRLKLNQWNEILKEYGKASSYAIHG